MPLEFLTAPKRLQRALLESLTPIQQFLKENPSVGVHHDDLTEPNIKLWLPVYVVPASALSGSESPGKRGTQFRLRAKRVGWRCFLKTKHGVHVAIELELKDSVEVHHRFQQGVPIENVVRRVRTTARRQWLRRKYYTARLLFVPSLYFGALWCRGKGSEDRFVLLASFGSELKPGRPYSHGEIWQALAVEISKRKAAHQLVLVRKDSVLRKQAP